MSRVEVHKFGGTSVGDAHRMRADARLVATASEHAAIVVVASAMTGITDALIAAAGASLEGDTATVSTHIDGVLRRHSEALDILGTPDHAPEVRVQIEQLCTELSELMAAVVLLGELTARTRDRIIAAGEKMSVRLLSLAMAEAGLEAVVLDADTFLETDDRFGEATPLGVVADRTIAAAIRPHLEAGQTPIVTGFCGIAPDGATTTLGRGGSDYTATLIAGALQADEVTIWTDVDGVFSADPRVVPGARCVDQLNYREAGELSFYGAKVLHQRTMIPVTRQRIPVRTRNSFNPAAAGTMVNADFTPGSHPVKAISAIKGQALVSIEGKGMSGVPGIAARVFHCLADQQISVTMISQSSSESSISLVVPEHQAPAAAAALKAAFRTDLSHGDIEEIVVEPSVGIVACVGLGMAHVPGVAGRVFAALGTAGVNILAIAQGSSELNISLAVAETEVPLAVRTLHDTFQLHRIDTGADQPDGLDLMLLGCGAIGRALIEQIMVRHAHVFERFGLRVRVVSLADRSGYLLAPAGLSQAALEAASKHKAEGGKLADLEGGTAAQGPAHMVEAALEYRLSRPILVDVSDSSDAYEAFLAALSRGCDVATANKKPLADDLGVYQSLRETAETHGRIIRAEATVGAGLPVIDTLEMLLATGDKLNRARGCLSGTLGYLMSALENGTPLSEAVRTAVNLGYTEPDPVADLSGLDVARKATILARLAGLPSADRPVELTGLVDAKHAGLSLDALYSHLASLDADFTAQVETAAAEGKVLRFVAEVSAERIVVGPVAVPKDSPLGGLVGSDNMIVFKSDRYNDRPLVITGPGAGIDVTAMGVLGDILRIAAERRQP
jgi:bifunctional aspartokinase / homoserine dehydrogenase 1